MRSIAATCCLLAAAAPAAPCQDDAATPAARPFVRFVAEPDGGQLETAIATYRRGATTVTLIASLHVADREHYEALQRRFDRFDKLLYEYIAAPDLRPHPGMEFEDDWLSVLMSGMGRGFALQQQEAVLDYRREHFVHADMTNEEFEAAMAQHGSSIVGELMSTPNAEVDREAEKRRGAVDLVEAFRSGRGAHAMRILGARTMAEPEPPTRKPTVIIEGRNEKCLSVLREQLDCGVRTIGIYYGAAHMQHMERRLLDDFGFELVGEEWITAWDCDRRRFPKVEKGLKQKRWRARRDLQKLQPVVVRFCNAHPETDPTWAAIRKVRQQGEQSARLPGREDGIDPWGRPYALRMLDGVPEVRSAGSDGELDTLDDVTLDDVTLEATPARRRTSPVRTQKKAAEIGRGQRYEQERKAWANATILADSVRAWARQHGKLPEKLADMARDKGRFARQYADDPWGNPYRLRGKTSADFEVVSGGPDGKIGTADDVSHRDARFR